MVGTLTGSTPFVPDRKCDIRDIAVVAKCFGYAPETPGWNANCDVNNDGKVDIRRPIHRGRTLRRRRLK